MATDADLDATKNEPDLDEDEPRSFAPSWPQVVVLVLALCFLSSAVTWWWTSRDPKPNATAVGFFDDMTTHHTQAIGMAITYLKHGNDRILGFIASDINTVQNGDIRQMQAALQEWGSDTSPDVAMEWMGMRVPQNAQPGMATDAQLKELAAARGRELDDLFSRLMIEHHQGGIHMADAAARTGKLTKNTAEGMASLQRSEINEINLRREQLGLERVPV
jgi:uncharacterized protein (DUF305 family)